MNKTFSILVSKGGAHWQAAVRCGIKGQRALLGNLTFNWDDTYVLKHIVRYLADRVRTRVIAATLERLGKEGLLRPMSPEQLVELAVHYGEDMRAEVNEFFTKEALENFGVDAVVGDETNLMNKPCPPGFLCHHEPACPGAAR